MSQRALYFHMQPGILENNHFSVIACLKSPDCNWMHRSIYHRFMFLCYFILELSSIMSGKSRRLHAALSQKALILACSFKSRYEETISFFAFSLVWTVSMLWVWVCITTEFLKIHFLLDSLYYAHRYHWSHSCILQYCWNECLYVTACRSKTDHIQSWAFNLYNQPCKQFTVIR